MQALSLQVQLSMVNVGSFFLPIISPIVDITLQLQFTPNLWFPFFSRFSYSVSVTLQDYFGRVYSESLSVHIANTFTNALVNLHCQQLNTLLAASTKETWGRPVHLDSVGNSSSSSLWQWHPVLHVPPLVPPPPLQHKEACLQGPHWYLSFLHPLARLWLSHLFSPIFQIFRTTSPCFSYALMFHRCSPQTPTDISLKFFKSFEKHPDSDVY